MPSVPKGQQVSSASAVGTVASVRDKVHEFLQRTEADEPVAVSQIHDHRLAVRVTTLPGGLRGSLTRANKSAYRLGLIKYF